MTFTIHNGNCIDVMRSMPDNSVDSIVTDPPYELGFMGKSWDSSGIAFNVEVWTEALRVLKPGGHLLAFSGSRTYHRMAVAIEDAGFQIRDQIMWIYGSGFPKSLDVSKAIDKGSGENRGRQLQFTEWMRSTGITTSQINEATDSNMGNHYLTDKQQPAIATVDLFDKLRHLLPEVPEYIERLVAERTGIEWIAYVNREIVGSKTSRIGTAFGDGEWAIGQAQEVNITAPSTPEAQQWAGWGTALKPAHEPIVLARKPLIGTVAANVLEFGTGGLNIDGSRVGSVILPEAFSSPTALMGGLQNVDDRARSKTPERTGRFPANLIHDGSDEVLAGFPDTGKSTGGRIGKKVMGDVTNVPAGIFEAGDPGYGDSGNAARFFYCAKASKRDRNEGLDGFEAIRVHDGREAGNKRGSNPRNRTNDVKVNHHPTVKPTDLMRYLVKLITPPGGTVLDPFTGSGSTGKGAVIEGFTFVGIELDPDYVAIATARIQHQLEQLRTDDVTRRYLKADS